MATTYTINAKLAKPAVCDRFWDVQLNANADRLDALSPLGGLCVTGSEVPSAGLEVRVAPGTYQRRDGTVGHFLGVPALSLPDREVCSLYLTDAGALKVSTTGYPAMAHVRLATVTTLPTSIENIADDRVVCFVTGNDSLPFLPLTGGTLEDGAAVALGTTTGTQLGTSTTQKLAFWGAVPMTRPDPYTQSYAATTKSLAAYTPMPQAAPFGGITNTQPGSGYAQVSDLNSLCDSYENLRLFSENVAQVLGALINDLRAMGLIG